ncbi:flagellar biosynthesis protein FlgK (plasmid) [Arthrobacter sp. ERGS1:01]|uniref:flagellar hook-associated protein FlgK n=1 Tax=Arthrobacter sp. ERGS1:01 TaxID=1704044 RepID=UPI0006B5C3FC|nr:flagellar hook-associated protein FlgK [Arthrobacter sp. ERGS1:01]ALE04194.1 flagellar biosynthesis protein FlgK [Arthrobacter sp. ERGS1:01]
MSTFSGLNTALSGLNAARTGLNTVGQNLTNVNTPGYTRQRAEFAGLGAPARSTLNDLGVKTGQGVGVTGITRLGDSFLDGRVRTSFSAAGYTSVRADALTNIENTLNEPGANGISSQLQGFWTAWEGVTNHAGEAAPSAVLLEKSASLVKSIASGYSELDTQWSQTRANADTVVADINTTATQVAGLNKAIRSANAAGTPANELIDQRDTLSARLAQLAGGTVRDLPGGGNEVLLGGNALVSGDTANAVKVTGAARMGDGGTVQLEWAHRPGSSVDLDGGKLAGMLSVLKPAALDGTGGMITQTAASYNALAQKLADTVNTVHQGGATPDGTTGHDFFTFTAGVPAALGLAVAPKDASGIAAGAVGAGGKDGSVADAISQLGKGSGSPDAQWSDTVVRLGVDIQTGLRQAVLADLTLNNAVSAQQANATVDLDEENVNLLSFQHAYQAAARVMTAIDESLDVLINQTGRVGR